MLSCTEISFDFQKFGVKPIFPVKKTQLTLYKSMRLQVGFDIVYKCVFSRQRQAFFHSPIPITTKSLVKPHHIYNYSTAHETDKQILPLYCNKSAFGARLQWNLFITRSLGPWKLPLYQDTKTKKYKELGPAKWPCYKRVLLYPTSL